MRAGAADFVAGDTRLTAAEVAELAGVGRAAVSNWRRRFDDFPQPVAVAPGGGDLFAFADIEAWLRRHGRLQGQIAHEKVLWHAFDAMRSQVAPERIVEVACAFIGLLATDGAQDVAKRLRARAPDELAGAVADAMRIVTQGNRDLEELFAPLGHLEDSTGQLLWALVQLTEEAEDLATLFEAVLTRQDKLRVYGGAENGSATSLVDLLVRLARPAGTVFDPAVGEGGFLLAAADRRPASSSPLRLVGQEINDHARRIARLRFLVHRVPAEIFAGDSLVNDAAPDLRADVVVCDPPFGSRWRVPPVASDPRWFAGLPGEASADLGWVQHVIHHLSPTGRGYITLPGGSLFRRGRDGAIRRELLRRGCIEAVATLPGGMIQGSTVPASLWILRRPDTESTSSPVLLINAGRFGHEDRERLDESFAAKTIATLKRFRQNPAAVKSEDGFATAITVLQLLDPDTTLLPAHWIKESVSPGAALAAIRTIAEDVIVNRAAVLNSPMLPPLDIALTERDRATVRVRDLAVEVIKGVPIHRYVTTGKGTPVLVSPWSRRTGGHQFVDLDQLKGKVELTKPGDVVVMIVGKVPRAFVDDVGGHVLPDFMQGLRIKDSSLDSVVFAALLSAPANARFVVGATIPRLSLLEVELPRLTANEPAALRKLLDALSSQEAAAEQLSRSATDLRDNILDAIVAGHLQLTPPEGEMGPNAASDADSRAARPFRPRTSGASSRKPGARRSP